ncbi:CRTAC1 family protein [Pseudomarimonas salicorniae]|uniref:CRTAC1 family protein n=1 Tax=Pseudomarimonas salicorniae TaxID=2933270 RepID=A0ABT0GG11_9GAMM|nr:CRTAC1 family protein [Lysobacter sp. CAU 1642]MCK7592992.1 CRTAC1 family protein [Lysobacter sp. CAU 1642]
MSNEPLPPHDDAGEEGDDRIIGRAFRTSLGVLLVLGLVTAAALGLRSLLSAPPEQIVDEGRAALESLREPPKGTELPALPFVDVTSEAGIDFVHRSGATGERLLPETMGGGVAWLDHDGDGLEDLLLVDSGPWPGAAGYAEWPGALRLYRNRGDGRFEDVTAAAGLAGVKSYGMGPAVGDIDGDGDADLFLAAVGPNRLFRNENGRFVEITEGAGVAGEAERWSSSAGFFDMDGDGLPELWVVNYVEWSRQRDFEVDYRLDGIGRAYGPPSNFPGTDSYLYRNLGGGRFEDISAAAGIRVAHAQTGLPVGKGLALITQDLDGDGWTDVMVANDTVRNFVFRNLGGKGFEEVGEAWGLGYDRNGQATGAMGIDLGEVFGDGSRAIAIGNFANEMSSFYVAHAGSAQFADEAIVAGIGPASRLALSFGVQFVDADLDGRLDLVQANGHVENEIARVQQSQQYPQSAQLFWQCGQACRSDFVSLPEDRIGDLAVPMVGRGVAAADFDRDGDPDLVLTQVGGPPRLLRNDQASGHHWLSVSLRGRAPNTEALGALVTLEAGGRRQQRSAGRNRSYLSQTPAELYFGLGTTPAIDRLEVRWPDGSIDEVRVESVDRHVVIEQAAAAP